MYWPIGAPRVYAPSKHQLPREKITSSDDGAKEEPSAEIDGEKNILEEKEGQPWANGDTVKQGEYPSQVKGQKSIAEQGEPPRETSDSEGLGEEIIGLRVTRSGQTFGTITRSTLTIWQTKVAANPSCIFR